MPTPERGGAIAVPNFPPDEYGAYSPFNGHTGWNHAMWFANETTDTVISVRRHHRTGETEARNGPTNAYRRIHSVHQIGEMGLRPVLDALDIHTELARDVRFEYLTYSSPLSPGVVAVANQLTYPPDCGRGMQFEIFDGGVYSRTTFFDALRRGVMLLSTGGTPGLAVHDLADHLVVGLSLTDEMRDALINTAKRLMTNPQTFKRFKVRQEKGLKDDFLHTYDYLLYAPTFMKFLQGDLETLWMWTSLLETDFATIENHAVSARERLSKLGAQFGR